MSKHMSLSDRTFIEQRLYAGTSIRQIADEIGKAPSTVSREIRGHRIVSDKSGYGRIANRCIHRMDCCASNLCAECKHDCNRFCRTCNLCNSVCADYIEEHCSKLDSAPYEMSAFLYGNDALNSLLRLLCLTIIPPDLISLKSSILFSL